MEYPRFFYRKYIFKGAIFHCYVSLPECNFLGVAPSQDASDHQNYYMFSRNLRFTSSQHPGGNPAIFLPNKSCLKPLKNLTNDWLENPLNRKKTIIFIPGWKMPAIAMLGTSGGVPLRSQTTTLRGKKKCTTFWLRLATDLYITKYRL